MAKRTQTFQQLPWTGGINTSTDEALIGSNDLVKADNIVYDERNSKKKRQGIDFNWDDASNSDASIIKIDDYWFESGNTKLQRKVAVDENGRIYTYDDGTRTDRTEQPEITTVNCKATADITNEAKFALWGGSNTKNIFAYDTDGSGVTGVDTDHTIDISGDTTASEVATTTKNVIDALTEFSASVSGEEITITNSTNGFAQDIEPDEDGDTNEPFDSTSVDQQGVAAWNSPSKVSSVTLNNIIVLAADGSNNEIKFWDGSNDKALDLRDNTNYVSTDPDPPSASILQTHLGRLWTNDKTDPDRLHFSETFNPFKWLGAGDSGAIDIGRGDNDPQGIQAIFPTFKGNLFVAKKTKLYRISGNDPASMRVDLVASNLGCVSHNSVVPVEQDDIFWISERGVHSLASVERPGDFSSQFVSTKIQRSFNNDWDRSTQDRIQGAYLASINSIAYTVHDTSLDNIDGTANNSIWLYNIPTQAWYRWPNIAAESITLSNDSDKLRFYLGTDQNRVAQTQTGEPNDVDNTGSETSIGMEIETGLIFVDDSPYTEKAFKRIGLAYRPVGNPTILARVKIDNFRRQSIAFDETGGGTPLGAGSFTLGSTPLGSTGLFSVYNRSLDGIGRGIKIILREYESVSEYEIEGFVLEYEPSGSPRSTDLD